MPKKQKRAVWAIYAFCRKVDDIVDEGSAPKSELDEFERNFHSFLEGEIPENDPMWIALEDVFSTFSMDPVYFQEMIDGQRKDIESHIVETEEELLLYCYQVASTVGLMLLPVLAPGKESELRQSAIDLGKGMQLTNILRDVGEDIERERIYIPKTLLDTYGYSYKELRNHEQNEAFIQLWEDLAAKAEMYYESSLMSIHEYPMYSRAPVKGAAYLYRAILPSIRDNQYQVFNERNFVSDQMKKNILSDIQLMKA